jgi:DNA-binding CsgD family transcriptional regulator
MSLAVRSDLRMVETELGKQLLTDRELEVLKQLVTGKTSKEIAEMLNIGPRTVESHRARMCRKLGFRSPVGMARYAIENGILPLEQEDKESLF